MKTLRNLSNLLNLNPLLAIVLLIVSILAIMTSIPACSSDSNAQKSEVDSESPVTIIDALGQEISFNSTPQKQFWRRCR